MSAGEVKAMGGAQHPVVGNYGVMSAKNGAVNIMILVTTLSFLYYRRANRTMTVVPWAQEREHPHRRRCMLSWVGAQHYLAFQSMGTICRQSFVSGCRRRRLPTTLTVLVIGVIHQPYDAQGLCSSFGQSNGGKFMGRAGGSIRIGCGIYVGHGSHGLYPLLQTGRHGM